MSTLAIDTRVCAEVSAAAAVVHGVIAEHQSALGWCRCYWRELAMASGLTERQVGYALAQLEQANLLLVRDYPTASAGRAQIRKVMDR